MMTLRAGESEIFDTIDGNASWISEPPPSRILQIKLVKEEHFGIYYCVLSDRSRVTKYVIKRALNYEGPSFGNVWPKYRRAAAIALGTSGGWVALWILGLALYYFGIKKDEPEESVSVNLRQLDHPKAYENGGYEDPSLTKIQTITDTKM